MMKSEYILIFFKKVSFILLFFVKNLTFIVVIKKIHIETREKAKKDESTVVLRLDW